MELSALVGICYVLRERSIAELVILLELAGSALHSRRCHGHHHHPQPRRWELGRSGHVCLALLF